MLFVTCRKPDSSIPFLSQNIIDSRQRFVDFCTEENLVPMKFDKPVDTLMAYRAPETRKCQHNVVDTSIVGQIEYTLVNHRWKNMVNDIDNIKHTVMDSNHRLMIVKPFSETSQSSTQRNCLKHRAHGDQQAQQYNDEVRRLVSETAYVRQHQTTNKCSVFTE